LKRELKKMGFDIGNSKSPITPVMIGDDEKALEFSKYLMREGVFASAIRFPMVAKGAARIRIIPSASHSREDLDRGLKAFARVGNKLKVIK
jgi:glycine C-acetyltransferase